VPIGCLSEATIQHQRGAEEEEEREGSEKDATWRERVRGGKVKERGRWGGDKREKTTTTI